MKHSLQKGQQQYMNLDQNTLFLEYRNVGEGNGPSKPFLERKKTCDRGQTPKEKSSSKTLRPEERRSVCSVLFDFGAA